MQFSETKSFYLYGLCQQPSNSTQDAESSVELYKRVIGEFPGIVIGASLHPYQLVNEKGTTVWQAAFVSADADSGTIVFMGRPAGFEDIRVWPDARLSTDTNPVFAKYVPFIIPFQIPAAQVPNIIWDHEIKGANPGAYVQSISQMIGFLVPPPAFVLGFDEFDEAHPEKMIDRFVRFIEAQGLK